MSARALAKACFSLFIRDLLREMSAVILAWSAQWESLPQQADKKLV